MKLIYILIITVMLSGCQRDMNRNEISDIDFVRMMGIDKTDGYKVSLLIERDEKPQIKTAEAETVFEAYEKIAENSEKPVTLAHTKYFILNIPETETNMEEILDFIIRDEKIKTDVAVYVTREKSAEDFLKSDDKISDKFDSFGRRILFYSTKQPNTLTDLYNPQVTSLLPVLKFEKDEIMAEGYALVQNMKVLAITDSRIATGLNFIGDNVRSGGIFTKDAGMMIYDSKTKIKDSVLNIYFMTNIKEITKQGSIYNVEALTKSQNDYVGSIVNDTAFFLRKNGIIYKKFDPNKTKIKINSKITGTFDIE